DSCDHDLGRGAMNALPIPTIDDRTRPYWDGLAQGELRVQHCTACDRTWLPARDACPFCLSATTEWRRAMGRGRIVSWVVYHTAYHDALKDRVPYNVALVELDEGPRLLTNIVDVGGAKSLFVGARVELSIEMEGTVALARFRMIEAVR